METKHIWSFFKAGGVYQVKFESGSDIANLRNLDLKLWTALSCPVKGTNLDEKTLALIDTDCDGKIRAQELIEACEWTCKMLKNSDSLLSGSRELEISNICDDNENSKIVKSAALHLAKNFGKNNTLLPEDFDKDSVYENTVFNADGIIIPESAEDDAVCADLIKKIADLYGAKKDRSGKDGIDLGQINAFFDDLNASQTWLENEKSDNAILFLGNDTAAAYAAYNAIAEKLNDYFTRRAVLSYDNSAANSLNPTNDTIAAIFADADSRDAQLKKLPLALIGDSEFFDFEKGVNPAWQPQVDAFKNVASKILGDEVSEISAADFAKIAAKFAPFAKWISAKPNDLPDKLGEDFIAKFAKSDYREKLAKIVEKDETLRAEYDAIFSVEKLVRLNADLLNVLTNFVSFKSFYEGKNKSAFQVGRLYIDQRVCDLCIAVENVGNHSAMSALSYTYLLYCDCKRAGMPPMTIVAAVTSGDNDNLMAGRNGVFYDNLGRDWDAVVVKVVENPISIAQAFWSPYKKCSKWISEQIAKFASQADEKAQANLQTSVAAPQKKIDVGTVAALGVAVSGLTATFGILLDSFFGLGWYIPLGIVGIILAISLPSMVLAALKLRTRNLGPLLDANGWAVNTRAKINIAFGGMLTKTASLPKGSKRDLLDPYSPHHGVRNFVAILALITAIFYGAWYFGCFENAKFLPQSSYMKAKAEKENADKAKAKETLAKAATAKPENAPAK